MLKQSPWNQFTKIKQLGVGGYAVVYLAENKKNKKQYAIKETKVSMQQDGLSQSTLREFILLNHNKFKQHNNFCINLHSYCYDIENQKFFLIFQYYPYDLNQFLKTQKPNAEQIRKILIEILLGMCYLHKHRIIHRDIKPRNILITEDLSAKIADFGLSRKFFISYKQQMTNQVATLNYKAPQLLFGNQYYSFQVDMWSYGCIIAEMSHPKRLPAFNCQSEIELIFQMIRIFGYQGFKNLKNYHQNFPKSQGIGIENTFKYIKDKQLMRLLKKCLKFKPKQRYTPLQALSSEYFSSIRHQYTTDIKYLQN